MAAITPKGLIYPVDADLYDSTDAFGALAKSADAAIESVSSSAVDKASSIASTASAETKAHVERLIAAHELGDLSDAQIDKSVQRILNQATWQARQGRTVHVSDFGAAGDGVTDDTAAIADALATGRHVTFSNVTYRISGPLEVPSGTVVSGNGARIVSSKPISSVFVIAGSASTVDVNLLGTYDAGATVLTTEKPHGLQAGEVFRLVGQRCAASADMPVGERLGMSTSNTGVPWIGEYLKVRKVVSSTAFETGSGLIFSGYRQDKARETHERARERTTLNKMVWAERVIIEGFRIDLQCTTAIRMDYARDCVIRDIYEVHRADTGYVVAATGCYRCVVTDVHTEYVTDAVEGTALWLRNLIKIISCQNFVVDRCTADGGEQVVDMTYIAAAMIPTIACIVRACEFAGYDSNAVTVHPGVWGAVIEGNNFRASNTGGDASSGIGVRAPYSVIRNNQIASRQRNNGTSNGNAGNYGINLYDGGGHHCQVEGNQIRGFDIGIGVTDGNEEPERHGTLYTTISGNWIENCQHSIRLFKSGLTWNWSGVGIMGNYITTRWAEAVGVNFDSSGTGRPLGVVAMNNRMHFTGTGQIPFSLGSAVDPVLSGNVVTGTATNLYYSPNIPANGTIVLSANVLTTQSSVRYYPALGTTSGGSVSVRPDPSVAGAILIGD